MNFMRSVLVLTTVILLLSTQLAASDVTLNDDYVDRISIDSVSNIVEDLSKRGEKVRAIDLICKKGKKLLDHGEYLEALILLEKVVILSNSGKDTIQHPEIKRLYMESLNLKSGAFSHLARYEDAISCAIAMDKYNVDNDRLYRTKFNNVMGISFAMSGKIDQSIECLRRAINSAKTIPDETERNNQIFYIYSNLVGPFISNKKFDSAQMYLMDMQKMAIATKDKKKEIISLQYLGYLNSNMGKYNLSLGYYDDAYNLAIEWKLYYLIPFIKLNIALCYIETKDYDKALSATNDALTLVKNGKLKKIEIFVLKTLSSIYKDRGDYKQSLAYLEKSNALRDSVFSQENEARFLQQKQNFDLYQIQIEKEIINKDLKIERSLRLVNNLIAFFVILILLCISLWFVYKLFSQYKLNKELRRRHADDVNIIIEEKKVFEDEIVKKDKDISKYTLFAARVNEAGNTILSKLKVIKNNLPMKNKGYDAVKEIEEIIREFKFSENQEYDNLSEYFDKVSSDFYYKLECRYPDLTLSERKMCALISLGLSTKELLNITGKTNSAIGNIKLRIRKKMNVDSAVDLGEFLSQI